MSPTLSRADRSRNRLRRVLVAVTALAGSWLMAAGALLLATPMLEILAWQPMHRSDYEGAEPFLRARVALTRVGTCIHVPGQRLRLAGSLGDLAEARERRVPNTPLPPDSPSRCVISTPSIGVNALTCVRRNGSIELKCLDSFSFRTRARRFATTSQ